ARVSGSGAHPIYGAAATARAAHAPAPPPPRVGPTTPRATDTPVPQTGPPSGAGRGYNPYAGLIAKHQAPTASAASQQVYATAAARAGGKLTVAQADAISAGHPVRAGVLLAGGVALLLIVVGFALWRFVLAP